MNGRHSRPWEDDMRLSNEAPTISSCESPRCTGSTCLRQICCQSGHVTSAAYPLQHTIQYRNWMWRILVNCRDLVEWFSALNEPFHHIYDPSLCIFYAAPQTWLIDGFGRVESSLRRTKTRMKGGWHTGAKWTIFLFMWLRSDFLMTVWTAQDLRRKIRFFFFLSPGHFATNEEISPERKREAGSNLPTPPPLVAKQPWWQSEFMFGSWLITAETTPALGTSSATWISLLMKFMISAPANGSSSSGIAHVDSFWFTWVLTVVQTSHQRLYLCKWEEKNPKQNHFCRSKSLRKQSCDWPTSLRGLAKWWLQMCRDDSECKRQNERDAFRARSVPNASAARRLSWKRSRVEWIWAIRRRGTRHGLEYKPSWWGTGVQVGGNGKSNSGEVAPGGGDLIGWETLETGHRLTRNIWSRCDGKRGKEERGKQKFRPFAWHFSKAGDCSGVSQRWRIPLFTNRMEAKKIFVGQKYKTRTKQDSDERQWLLFLSCLHLCSWTAGNVFK